jgi:hypothetical protein
MDNWRFRTNWRGKLILQRRVRELAPVGPSLEWVSKWRDATAKDLAGYYRDLHGKGGA